jgi:hypothetical protein
MNYIFIDETTIQTDLHSSYIYINNKSLSKSLCDKIIELYNLDDKKYDGITKTGVDKNVKDTRDLIITNDIEWIKIKRALQKELIDNLKNYIEKLDDKHDYLNENQNTDSIFINFIDFSYLSEVNTFMIQKYNKNIGKFVYHNDYHIDFEERKHRIITFLWYLNDVYEGGETVFSGKYAVKPTTGKLVLFPATWSYPHCGKVPISNDKYILTGWIYMKL